MTTRNELISREIKEAATRMIETAMEEELRAFTALESARAQATRAKKMLECDRTGSHEFVEVPLSGRMGSRFEEKCIHCGWIHTC